MLINVIYNILTHTTTAQNKQCNLVHDNLIGTQADYVYSRVCTCRVGSLCIFKFCLVQLLIDIIILFNYYWREFYILYAQI